MSNIEFKNEYDFDFMGFLNIHRKIIYSSVFSDAQTLQLFLYCLARANWESKEIIIKDGEIIKLERGQFISSIKKMAKACNSTSRKIRTRTKTLILTHRIDIKTTSRYSLITVLNYNNYQSTRQAKRTAERQTNDKRTTTDKHYKHYNNKILYKYNTENAKKKVNFDNLPEFWKCKIKSLSNFERILAYFYVFEGYNFKNEWELKEQIRRDLGYYETNLQIITGYTDHKILEIMANLRENNNLTIDNCAQQLKLKPAQINNKTNKIKTELANKMAM